ncbi:MAG: DUF1858 domain-containing protein [Bacteroidetes bacterium]|nr:DUF1858 domain-containing protein [Bacteroidota bacterium]
METKLVITPQTKIAELLEAYPELESVLIDMAPAFKKLQNPVLRKTVARVTSIRQAAAIGKLPVDTLVNRLRGLTGQGTLNNIKENPETASDKPDWLSEDKIKITFDASEMISGGGHPLTKVIQDLKDWKAGDIYLLKTPFLPAPLMDKVKDKGFQTWSVELAPGSFLNYFFK